MCVALQSQVYSCIPYCIAVDFVIWVGSCLAPENQGRVLLIVAIGTDHTGMCRLQPRLIWYKHTS